jgi:hypothetical protein
MHFRRQPAGHSKKTLKFSAVMPKKQCSIFPQKGGELSRKAKLITNLEEGW